MSNNNNNNRNNNDSTTNNPNKGLQALSVPGGRGRAACARVADFTGDLAAALRRAVPFLARRRVPVIAETPRCVSFADLTLDTSIVYVSAFTARQGSHGLVLIDEIALARILDGVLGGDGQPPPASPAPLTSAQYALASRVASGMLRAFGNVMSPRLGVSIEPFPAKAEGSGSGAGRPPAIEGGSAALVTLVIDGGGRVLIAIPLSAIRMDEGQGSKDGGDANQKHHDDGVDENIAAAMTEVELDVVAELGRVRLPLEALVAMRVGDVIRLSLPLDERARVCAGGTTLFHGRPTASGDVVAVALERSLLSAT